MPQRNAEEVRSTFQRLADGIPSQDDIRRLQYVAAGGHIRLQPIPTHELNSFKNNGIKIIAGDTTFEISATTYKNILNTPYIPPPLPRQDNPAARGGVSPGSYLPIAIPTPFVGRQDNLKSLAERFLYNPTPQNKIAITHGVTVSKELGGAGKTWLALEFCYRYGRFFQGVYWLQAEYNLLDELALSARSLDLSSPQNTTKSLAKSILSYWETSPGPHLVVLDGISTQTPHYNWLKSFPSTVSILATTKQADWINSLGFTLHPLEALRPEESAQLLRLLAPHLDKLSDEDINTLSDHLNGMPMSLNLAGRYIANNDNLSIMEFFSEIKSAREMLTKAIQTSTNQPVDIAPQISSLALAAAVSWKQLRTKNNQELTWRIFQTCGYCAPNKAIPAKLLTEALNTKEDKEIKDFNHALATLSEYGLLTQSDQSIFIHPLLKEFSLWAEEVTEEINILPKLSDALINLARKANEEKNFSLITSLHHHLCSTAVSAEKVRLKPAGALWNSLGYHLWLLEEYPAAQNAFEHALKLTETAFGAEHSNVAAVINNLGEVFEAQDLLLEAEACYQRALHIWGNIHGSEDRSIAVALNNLASAQMKMGQLSQARKNLERALTIFGSTLGPDNEKTITTVEKLGDLLYLQKEFEGAKACYEQTLNIFEKTYGIEHPNTLPLLSKLGKTLLDLQDFEAALPLLEDAMRAARKSYGIEQAQTAKSINNVGICYLLMQDFKKAQAFFQMALRINEAVCDPQHPAIADTALNLGKALQADDNSSEAEACFEWALQIYESTYYPSHPTCITTHIKLALCYLEQNKIKESDEQFKIIFHKDQARFGPFILDFNTHYPPPEYLSLWSKNDLQIAKKHFEQMLQIDQNLQSEEHPDAARDSEYLGEILYRLQQANSALTAFERAKLLYEINFGVAHKAIASLSRKIGWLQWEMRNTDIAKKQLEHALHIDNQILGEEHLDTARDHILLGYLYQEVSNIENSQTHLHIAIDILKKHLAPQNPIFKKLSDQIKQ